MSMSLEFEPHSWYYEFAIKKNEDFNDPCEWRYEADGKVCLTHDQKINPIYDECDEFTPKWEAFTDNGNTYRIVGLYGETKRELQEKIIKWWFRNGEDKLPAYYATKLKKSKEALNV